MRYIGLILLIVLVSAATFACLRSRSQPTSEADLAAIEQLRSAGSNLKLPHAVDFYLYFPTEEKAHAAMTELGTDEFTGIVRLGADNINWLFLANKTVVPSADNFSKLRRRIEKVVMANGGEYDGWEAEVVR